MRVPRPSSILVLLATVLVGLAAVAAPAAATQPHDRNGFFIGFGVGGGSATVDTKGGSSDSQGGGVGNFRVGGAVTPQLLLGLESTAWTRTESTDVGDVTTTLSVATFGVSWYPILDQGFYLRGGLGFGTASVEIDLGGVKVSGDETGLGLLAAAGYEWRLTRKFALGPQVEVTYMGIDDDVVDSATTVAGTLDFDWYW